MIGASGTPRRWARSPSAPMGTGAADRLPGAGRLKPDGWPDPRAGRRGHDADPADGGQRGHRPGQLGRAGQLEPAAGSREPWPGGPGPASRAARTAAAAAASSSSELAPSVGKRARPTETLICPAVLLGQAGDAVEDPLGDGHPGGAGRDQDELVAAVAGDRVDEPDRLGQDGRDRPQDVVAGLVAGRPR